MLAWAAPQGWMVEPQILTATGRSIEDHQRLTVDNVLRLRSLWPRSTPCLFIPVLQGWSAADYVRCAVWYERGGLDLAAEPLVGVGSVCRRQAIGEIREVFTALRGLRLHGFGVKVGGVRRCADLISSADSMAWSWAARAEARAGQAPTGCRHRSCTNCPTYAARWYRRVVRAAVCPQPVLPLSA